MPKGNHIASLCISSAIGRNVSFLKGKNMFPSVKNKEDTINIIFSQKRFTYLVGNHTHSLVQKEIVLLSHCNHSNHWIHMGK